MQLQPIGRWSARIAAVLALLVVVLTGCSKSTRLMSPNATGSTALGQLTAAVPSAGSGAISPDPADHHFVAWSTNRWFPLVPGSYWQFRSTTPDGVETERMEVTDETVTIDGVRVRVVTDLVKLDGKVIERTRDYFAMDEKKNVWYFGEDTQSIDPETGETSTHGTWRSGVDGAMAGIIMLGDPDPGEDYAEENAPGVAQDHAKVVSLHADAEVPAGEWNDRALKTENTTPLEPDVLENKYYVPGVGLVLEVDQQDGTRNRLVRYRVARFDGDGGDDDVRGPVANQK